MKHTLTLEFDSAEELTAYLNGKGTGPATPKGSPRNQAPPEDPEPEMGDGSEGITYDEISALVLRLSKEKGRDVAVNFLKGFKNPANKKPATKGAEIAPADYPKAKEQAEELLAAEEDLT